MKNLVVGFLACMTVLIILCVMELHDEVSPLDGALLGFAAVISSVGCIAAAVGLKSIED